MEGRRALRGDVFDQLRAVEDLDVDTQLVRRETVIADLDVVGAEATLSYEGRTLRLPGADRFGDRVHARRGR